jgi:hypothetical protein
LVEKRRSKIGAQREEEGRGSCSSLGLLFLPLFSGVRGRKILRRSFAGSCIDLPLRAARMALEPTHAIEVKLDGVPVHKDPVWGE